MTVEENGLEVKHSSINYLLMIKLKGRVIKDSSRSQYHMDDIDSGAKA